jgi:hypothetical protein
LLRAVVKRDTSNGNKRFFIRIFDEDDAVARKIAVKNYTSLDDHQL